MLYGFSWVVDELYETRIAAALNLFWIANLHRDSVLTLSLAFCEFLYIMLWTWCPGLEEQAFLSL